MYISNGALAAFKTYDNGRELNIILYRLTCKDALESIKLYRFNVNTMLAIRLFVDSYYKI